VPEYHIEIFEPETAARSAALDGPVVIGRVVDGPSDIRVLDPSVSRLHVRLEPTAEGIVITDLGSSRGTIVNGHPIAGPVLGGDGSWLLLGDTQVRVHASVGEPATEAPGPVAPVPSAAPGAPSAPTVAWSTLAPELAAARDPAGMPAAAGGAPTADSAPAPGGADSSTSGDARASGGAVAEAGAPRATEAPARPAVEHLQALDAGGAAVIRFRPGTAGEPAARAMAGAAKKARKRLAGLGSEPTGLVPQICLVDPFPDPDAPGTVVMEGTVVDAARNEIWMVVSSESPPEPPERPLALLFGAALPAAAEAELLLEGYGLWLAEAPDPDAQLAALDLPPLASADGDLRTVMALSFVRFLIGREREEALRTVLATATPGHLDDAVQDGYGVGLAALERAWREQLEAGEPKAKTAQFLRLSLRYLKPHKRKQAEIFVYMLLALLFNMVFPFVTRALFDTAIPSGQFSQVLSLLTALGVALVISLLAGLRQAYLSAWISGAVVRDLRMTMFSRLQRLPTPWFARHQQGDVLTRLFSDVMMVEQGLTSTIRDGIFQLLSLVVSAIVMLTISPLLGVIVLAGAPLVAIVYRRMSKGARTRGLALQEDTSALMGVAAENYSAEPVVKIFSLQDREVGRFQRLSDRLFRSERRLNLFGGLFGLSVNSIVTVLRLTVLGLGSWLILQGTFTVGGLVAFLGIMGEVLSPVTVLTGIGQQVQAASGALHRVEEVTDEPVEFADIEAAVELAPLATAIELSDVGFAYSSEREVLSGVSAHIPAGSRVAFVGPSGSGKSTTLQLLMRLYDVDAGAITFDGVDIRSATLESLRGQLGVVFQESFLFDTSVRENIALGKRGATDAEVEAAAAAAEIDEFVASLPRGYETVVGERGGMLSGGQRQRVAIARALVRDPRVLLLDEATSALDPKTERQITATLGRIARGRTTIAITHRLTSVTDYDRIFVLVEGQIVESGTHDELVAAGGAYAHLWSEQTGLPVVVAGAAAFDAVAALRRVALFTRLDDDQLAAVASRLQAAALAPGQSTADGNGALLVLRTGRARVLVRGLGESWSVAAELGPGDSFGLNALLSGGSTGAWIEAIDQTELLVLDDATIAGLCAMFPSVAAVLDGAVDERSDAPVPHSGQRLSRATMAFRTSDIEAALAATRGGQARPGANATMVVAAGSAGDPIPNPGPPPGWPR